jgi:putative IMPACT (imprinted ancient) family translation regulator
VDDVAAAEAVVADVRAAHGDASHVVPCYRVREGDPDAGVLLREWQSDDGEPSGSAGKPALNVLVQRDVSDAVAAVVRYFGGTELGVGGLARAYSRAVSAAVDDAGVVDALPHETFTLASSYDDSGTVRSVLESAGVAFEAEYGETVTFEVRAPRERAPDLRERLRDATAGRVG